MSNANIEILFQSKTINLTFSNKINEKDLYNKFIQQIRKEINFKEENKNSIFKLMTMNTKEMYLIVNEDNFFDIINEKTKEGKIKLFLDIVDEKEENLIEPLEEGILGGINKKNDDGDDFNEKLNLSDSNEFSQNNKIIIKKEKISENNINLNSENTINNNIQKDNKNLINNVKNENSINNNIIKNEEKVKEFITLKPPKSKENNELNLSVLNSKTNLNIKTEESKDNNNKIINTLIENKNNQINNNENNVNQNNEDNQNIIEIVEICSICKKLIKDKIKYECCLCDRCTLCQNCEKSHEHPCIKFKIGRTVLSTLKDCHSFISKKHNFSRVMPIKYFKNLFNNTFDIILQLGIDDHIEVRPNKVFDIPVLIKNYSEYPVSSAQFILIIKNFSIVNITYDLKQSVIIQPKNYLKIDLKCTSKEKTGRDQITVEIYSSSIKIRESNFSKFNIEILVSNDEEDEEINKKFVYYPKIQLLNKLRKKMLLYILDNHFCEKSLTQIYNSLSENNWNLDSAINQLNNQI